MVHRMVGTVQLALHSPLAQVSCLGVRTRARAATAAMAATVEQLLWEALAKRFAHIPSVQGSLPVVATKMFPGLKDKDGFCTRRGRMFHFLINFQPGEASCSAASLGARARAPTAMGGIGEAGRRDALLPAMRSFHRQYPPSQ